MFITVLIPTYRRSKDLARCLEALKKQTRLANDILVVVRDIDSETRAFFETESLNSLQLRIVIVKVPGVVSAMNAGLDEARGDIIAITDDDAAPHPDWLERIEAHFLSDKQVGGVGGRDWLYLEEKLCDATTHPGASQIIGQMTWFGKLTGNHHIGEGDAREVDVLKGVNSSYRSSALKNIRLDERLKGSGAQVHWELALCLNLKAAGWKLIYDPKVAVDHFLGQRFDEDQRVFKFNAEAFSNEVHNETLIVLEHLMPLQQIIYLTWAFLIGTRQAFGLVQWLRFLSSERNLATQKFLSSLTGRWQGLLTWQQSHKTKGMLGSGNG